MATMVKEKRREKKKSKEKRVPPAQPSIMNIPVEEEISPSVSRVDETTLCAGEITCNEALVEEEVKLDTLSESHTINERLCTDISTQSYTQNNKIEMSTTTTTSVALEHSEALKSLEFINKSEQVEECREISISNEYNQLNARLERIQIPTTVIPISKEREESLEAAGAYIKEEVGEDAFLDSGTVLEESVVEANEDIKLQTDVLENLSPSAPMFEFEEPHVETQYQVLNREIPKLISMSLEEAINHYGGAEMSEVMAMSAKEEAAVEAGPISGPEHPLVDLLSTFKRSLIALEKERTQMTVGFKEEERLRNSLWKIEKKDINHQKTCEACGRSVWFKAKYEVATLDNDKLEVARVRLDGLLRDLQDSYCHHQHEAFLAFCQIEEFLSEVVQSNKGEIREALSLVLQALRASDSAPAALTSALQRWAAALAAAMLDGRDLRQLLFLIHHLFRQTRSVRWAARVVDLHVGDSAARALAVMELLLTRPAVDAAVECTEDKEEEWEEVDKAGGGGAVSDGSLRERDLLALLRALPLRDVLARILLFSQADIRQAREWSWGESRGGRDIVRACCGVRALVRVAHAACTAHARYPRLRRELRRLAVRAMRGLCAAHDHAKSSYDKDMETKVQAELEAVFVSGLGLVDPGEVPQLPAALLSHHAARDYCISHIVHLHESSPTRIESLSFDMAPLACHVRVRIVSQAAVDRGQDYELARIVLEFLFTVGVRRNSSPCGGACQRAARETLPLLLAAHAHLYPAVLLLIAETNPVEKLEPCAIDWIRVEGWRPAPGDVRAVLGDWARRCGQLLPPLLLALDYTPHTGLSLESQLSIGWWVCSQPVQSPSEEEWRWSVLRRLRVHRSVWGLPPDAPPPDPAPETMMAKAYALMASSWGHCVPIICSEGLTALCSLAASRVSMALHCLAPIMLLLAPAHDSIALTPKFTELFSLVVNASPSLMQRALGRGGASGADLLLRLVLDQMAEEQCGGVPRALLARAWTAALWRPGLLQATAVLDAAVAAVPVPLSCLDDHATDLARRQDEESTQLLLQAMRMSATAPLVCAAALRAWHTQRELLPALQPRLLQALHSQRLTDARIHVDNALKLIGASIGADELVVYRCAGAVLAAAPAHPAALQLWRLLMHLYLQRPPNDMRNDTPPVGPLFFSGLIKSRTLTQLKRRLQECITYHANEATTLAEAAKRLQKPTTSRVVTSESRSNDNDIWIEPSFTDLTGESSESSDTDSDWSDGEEKKIEKEESPAELGVLPDYTNLIAFHTGAKKLLTAYAQWLDEGSHTVATPHLADISRFIPEPAQAAAWQRYGASKRPTLSPTDEREPFPLPSASAPPLPPPPPTPFQRAVDTLLAIRNPGRKSRKRAIESLVKDVNFKDSRGLLALVDKHLKDIERLAQEWGAEVGRVSALDAALRRLVGGLRVPRALPPLRADCPNRCATLYYTPPEREWCKSIDTERAIKENKSRALAGMRSLARPRLHAAQTAAALLTIARRMADGSTARAACERAWRAGACVPPLCAPATAPITAFFEMLAERWLSADGDACASLVLRWGGGSSALQRRLCSAAVQPARVAPAQLPRLHAALLRAQLPHHLAFSCLSKFDMGRWAASVDSAARLEVLSALRQAILRWSNDDEDEERDMLVELLGVQSTMVCSATELSVHTRACAELMTTGEWPAPRIAQLVAAAQRVAAALPLDELGHLLRELGVLFWEARTGGRGLRHDKYPAYAPHVASLLQALHRAFVAAAVQQSYAPERVSVYAWSSLVESWGAWVLPHAAPPLLPVVADHEAYTPMLRAFHEAVKQVIVDYPGTDEHLLNQMFEWTVATYLGVQGSSCGQEGRVQLSALLAELAAAPWTRCQWLRGTSLQALLQVCQLADKEMCLWCSSCLGGVSAATWLRDAVHAQLPARLALLVHLLACAALQLPGQVLEDATTLPWHRLPEAALEEGLDRFFMEHHGLAVPYHELPQFKVVLAASEFLPTSTGAVTVSAGATCKRARLVSAWLRAASAPAHTQHVPAYQQATLDLIHKTAPHLEHSEGEIEDLLNRAMVILCIEPAAAAALPVWTSWVRGLGHSARVVAASVRGAVAVTAFEYFAPLADAAIAAYLTNQECGGWSSVRSLCAHSPWRAAAALCARARLHAAYATLLTHDHTPADTAAALLALLAADIDFVENEVMVAVWICLACRLAATSAGEVRSAGAALLGRWAEPQRRSLLKMVTLHADTDRPQTRHRALCLLALCIISGGEKHARELEAACSSLPAAGAVDTLLGPSRRPPPRQLPQLALRLFPGTEAYFQHEMEAAGQDPARMTPTSDAPC